MTKPGRKGINYQDVVRACKELEDQQEIVTVRKVLAITGGNFSTVSSYIRQWQQAQSDLQRSTALPEDLIEALKIAYTKMYAQERKLKEVDFLNERKIHAETLRQVVELESQTDKLTHELETLNHHYQNVTAAYEKKLAAAESRVSDAEKREKDLNDKLDEQRELLKQVEIKLAVTEAQSVEYQKQLILKEEKVAKK